jgi:hypothetical protein
MIRVLQTFSLMILALHAGVPDARADERLVGVWRAVTYVIDGKPLPMEGLFIFTPKYYSANVRFKLSMGPDDDSNGNAGPWVADGKRVVFTQWVQIHVRPGSAAEPILSREGPDESAEYQIDGKRLTLTFPSKNRYVLERLQN